ncbi:MAG: hypothetical protein WAM55_05455 [Methylovirgula sp.]
MPEPKFCNRKHRAPSPGRTLFCARDGRQLLAGSFEGAASLFVVLGGSTTRNCVRLAATFSGRRRLSLCIQQLLFQKEIQMLRRTLVALTATVALGCMPLATSAFAAGHSGHGRSGHTMAGRAGGGHFHGHGYAHRGGRHYGGYRGYRSYPGYGYGYGGCDPYYGCGYGPGVVGNVIGGILGF